MKDVKTVLNTSKVNSITVNSNKENKKTVNSNTVNSRFEELFNELQGKPEAVAISLAERLDDIKSLDYYKILCKQTNLQILLNALSFVKDADAKGKIRTNKAVYFLAILRNWKIQTKFRGQSPKKEGSHAK